MGIRVTIEFDGLEETIGHLGSIEESSRANLIKKTAELARDAETDWKEGTPVRTGKLMGADTGDPADLIITFTNDVFYYKFLDLGHRTPSGWHTAHGYRSAKRRSVVEARLMTERLVNFLERNISYYLANFLGD